MNTIIQIMGWLLCGWIAFGIVAFFTMREREEQYKSTVTNGDMVFLVIIFSALGFVALAFIVAVGLFILIKRTEFYSSRQKKRFKAWWKTLFLK